MQIIAGTLRGRKIQTIGGDAIRPTSSRTRESLFNILIHKRKNDGSSLLAGARFADLCCGSGAIGIEAISRGAHDVVFVDQMREAIRTAQHNATALGVHKQCHFIMADTLQLPPPAQPYDIVFADPPYDATWLPTLLERLVNNAWLHTESLVIIEQRLRAPTPEHPQLTLCDERTYGQSMLRFYQRIF
ncbi:MAG: 16S rRNA (guanine(966)-N(2))-methyltransferase RsmD [Alphaproteobacteria bacterium]|nr:MAG: 16S rRNA (guanine(966)-N(2))-methyltransferase RsmD [Alphaproteobacteria bacterium]TAF13594.1 MAG: 16S rRNA (guanine(966)-N(2))-methyltransferase RsmD [Alphaproteobacteria bacterium]TAF39172.1 MAG: 16S rRNA (guanine(966)-N(2))-methyltransferase RsmD [Alphaproteobacteria bacterium]TAF74965.1 MAG: 16S rRNA (guanine(966)-N(2))-methyltransferase RsmD [Alphaproteobacteria bacterium]